MSSISDTLKSVSNDYQVNPNTLKSVIQIKSANVKKILFFICYSIFIHIFVMRNKIINYGAIRFIQNKKFNDKGTREFKKLDSFLLLCSSFVAQRVPHFIHFKNLPMRNKERENQISVLRKNWTVAELSVSYKQKQKTGITISSSNDAYHTIMRMWDKNMINIQEQFCALYLNNAKEVIAFRLISTGCVNATTIDIPLIISCALLCRASGIILAHNHPSGNIKPSINDRKVTFNIMQIANYLNIDVLDHLIIVDNDYYSFVDNGIITSNKERAA